MKIDELIRRVGHLPCFDLATLVQLADARRETLVTQLYRLSQAGKIVALRRGLYVLASPYRKVPVHAAQLASAIYGPSYLSDRWALSFYGAIPEQAVELTSVTSRTPKRFENAFGAFNYRHVKPSLFFGFHAVAINGASVRIASPEKALVDHWYLEAGEWTEARLRALRLDPDAIDAVALERVVARADKPRLSRAWEGYRRVAGGDVAGEVAL